MIEKLTAIFKEMFKVESLNEDMSPENVEGWDSYAQIELALELESVFGVNISAEEAGELASVRKIIDFLAKKGVPA